MMTQEFEQRKERVESETLVIARTDEGFRVYAPSNPNTSYTVGGSEGIPTCTCPDFQYHEGDPQWRCKHILAVLNRLAKPNSQNQNASLHEAQPPEPNQSNGRPIEKARKKTSVPNHDPSQMLIKRSVSPDGRIDSLSVEFSCPVEKNSVQEIKERAHQTLLLQSVIVEGFLKQTKKETDEQPQGENQSNGAQPAQMLTIGGMNGKYGRRLFINVQANGQALKLFGNKAQLADAIVAAGHPHQAKNIAEGVQLNLSCRIITKPSANGKYQDIERVLPAQVPPSPGRARP